MNSSEEDLVLGHTGVFLVLGSVTPMVSDIARRVSLSVILDETDRLNYNSHIYFVS